jgi:beta-adrenergic-receptor kinase
VGGNIHESILSKVEKLRNLPGFGSFLSIVPKEAVTSNQNGNRRQSATMRSDMRNLSLVSSTLPENLFDEAELVVADNIREKYWTGFQSSEYHAKLLNFLWFQDRTVVEEDFFVMRVLGRGGFGLVTGEYIIIFFSSLCDAAESCHNSADGPLPSPACKKGTSGKLYAMKVMNKKRIKLKKAEKLTLSEQECLANVNSPFVVNLKYSFQSKTDVFLILDLMTGGDLSYHLSQKGCFPTDECLYYSARIILGLQALHDQGYVYRDLKPENCLLGDDGRVKLTDLGLAVKITPDLHGAAGTRGYWAPEMLDRDDSGKRKNYGRMVDWFSFGCCLAEFISGTSPFRSQAALDFGLQKGEKTKVTVLCDHPAGIAS